MPWFPHFRLVSIHSPFCSHRCYYFVVSFLPSLCWILTVWIVNIFLHSYHDILELFINTCLYWYVFILIHPDLFIIHFYIFGRKYNLFWLKIVSTHLVHLNYFTLILNNCIHFYNNLKIYIFIDKILNYKFIITSF